MNETPPPSVPPPEMPPPPPENSDAPFKPWQLTALGSGLFILSCLLTFAFPPLIFLGFIAAIVSLFMKGYRCIFLGYILTVSVVLLCVIIYCANHPLDIK